MRHTSHTMAPYSIPTVKLCVVMDLTASMSAWLQAAQEEAVRAVRAVGAEHHDKRLEVAFVGYRDFCDGHHRLVGVPFTTDLGAFERTLREQGAFGGGDIAEDVAGALCKAVYDLDWSSSVAQIMVIIADAPPHGIQWHTDRVSDDYPQCEMDTVPIPTSMFRFVAARNTNPSLMFLRLTKHTAILEEWLKQFMLDHRGPNRFILQDVSEVHQDNNVGAARHAFGNSLHLAVTHSLSLEMPDA